MGFEPIAPHIDLEDLTSYKIGDDRRHILVLLTDGLEDSEEYDFEHTTVTDKLARMVIRRNREQGRLPDMHKATVYIVGISAKTAAKTFEIKRFWL